MLSLSSNLLIELYKIIACPKLANFMLHLNPTSGHIVLLCTCLYKSKQAVQFWKEWRIIYFFHYTCLICHQCALFLIPESPQSNLKTRRCMPIRCTKILCTVK